jgi:hypothetical protein
VTNAYGRALTEALKLDGLTPRAPNQLINYAERFLQASQPMPTIPAPLKAWLAFDLAAARAEIEPLVPALKASQQTVAREERETQQTRLQRDRAHARWLEQMNLHIQITRAALRAAQLGELADRLLPTARQLQGVEPPGPTPDDSPPSPATP